MTGDVLRKSATKKTYPLYMFVYKVYKLLPSSSKYCLWLANNPKYFEEQEGVLNFIYND
jgi:hypothetical protein